MKTIVFKHQRGSVLVVALLILVAGTVGMTTMASLVSNRSRFVLDSELAAKRRLAIRNSKALTSRYFLGQAIASDSTAKTISLSSDSGWGKVDIPTTVSAFDSLQNFSLVNLLSPGGESGFTKDVNIIIKQSIPYVSPPSESSLPYRVQLKSRSPILAGTLFVQHKPSLAVVEEVDISGSIRVNGHAVFWTDEDLTDSEVGGFIADSYDFPGKIGVSMPTASGGGKMASNFPFFPRTTGLTSGATNATAVSDGSFNLIESGTTAQSRSNTVAYKMNQSSRIVVDGGFNTEFSIGAVSGAMINNAGEGPEELEITVDLDATAVSPVHILDGVHHVKLLGFDSGSGDSEPVAFIFIDSADLETIQFENNNDRRLVLGVKSDGPIVLRSNTPLATWRTILTIEQAPFYLDLNGSSLTMQGGVRTDARFAVKTGGSLILNREPLPDSLEIIDTREAWVEIYPQPPTL